MITMTYFEDVYLKRINRFGSNIQERIQGKKEYDFEYFKAKSPNKVKVYENSKFISDGVLQNKTNSEKEVIDYLLVNKDVSFPDGTILETEQFVDLKKNKWLIFHLDEYVSIGYNRYQLVELDRTIEWIEDGLVYSEDVHFTGSGANLRDKSITSKFTIQYNLAAVYLPNKILNLIMRTNPNFKKGTRLLINDEVWKVSGIDKISVPGVSYVTMEEDYVDKMDDIDYANSKKLLDWTIQSNYGDNIQIPLGVPSTIQFISYYQDEKRNEPISFNIEDDEIVKYENEEFTGLQVGTTKIKAFIEESPEIYKDFKLEVLEQQTENFSIIGPEKIKMFDIVNYQISNINNFVISIESENDNLIIKEIGDDYIIIEGAKIGIGKLVVKKEETVIYEKEISIESIWMEG